MTLLIDDVNRDHSVRYERQTEMVFSNLIFLYFFMPLLFLAYFIIKNNAYRRGVLVVFSLIFYAWGEPVCIFLMIGLVFADYIFGLIINSRRRRMAKKLWLAAAVISNLSVLVFYKYLGFFVDTFNTLTGLSLSTVSVVMPIGISFFTFQSMSYVIDIYRKDASVQRSFFKLLLYVSFFPQLIAGPIVRYKDIESQLSDRKVDVYDFNEGLFRFAQGLAKKVLIANCCDSVVTSLYGLAEVTTLARWAGAVFFTLQIYYDFSGYSDMAIGLGRMFGFRFNENFNYPLVSGTVTDFWRRWHISLGTFFRDYVYIPLGGNRRHHVRNILVTWFLTGLWHGASWNFILWGVFYGVMLLIEKKVLLGLFDKMAKPVGFIIKHIYVAFLTVFGFAVFYFDHDLLKNIGYLFGIGCTAVSDIFTNSIIMENAVILVIGVLLSAPIIPALWKAAKERFKISYSAERVIKTVVVTVLISAATVRLVGNTYDPFLYFRF